MIQIRVTSQSTVEMNGELVPVPVEAQGVGELPRFILATAAKRLPDGASSPIAITTLEGELQELVLHANGTTSRPDETAAVAPSAPQYQAPAPQYQAPSAAPAEWPARAPQPPAAADQKRPAIAPQAPVDGPPPAAYGMPPEGAAPATRREARTSFIQPATERERAQDGWRGLLARTGLNVGPSAVEVERRKDERNVSQHWPGPRTIAIVNGKGGANKTPTTAMLAAVFARYGGSGVLVWDNNETRGSLGWRTEQGPHEATVQHLLPETDRLLSPQAQSADLSYFVHHQTADKYDVLRSNPQLLAADQRIDAADFDKLHGVASKYFRLIFIDSGNDESAERWLRMIDHTTQLVVATVEKQDHAEAGALLLEALAQRGAHGAHLAQNAVVVVSQSEKGAAAQTQHIASEYQRQSLARAAITIPYDDALHEGPLRFSELGQRTQRAWLHAAASVAAGL